MRSLYECKRCRRKKEVTEFNYGVCQKCGRAIRIRSQHAKKQFFFSEKI